MEFFKKNRKLLFGILLIAIVSIIVIGKEYATFETADNKNEFTCSISVTCDAVLQNMDKLNPDKLQIVPENGIIFAMQTVSFEDGESVFDVLVRELRRNKIHVEFKETPGLGTAYIEGIGNIYEFDLGDMSGWTYTVNGESPSVGCSDYLVKDGDSIKFEYVCY